MKNVSRYLAAVISAVLMLLMTSILSGIVLTLIMPERFKDMYMRIGMIQANIPSLLALLIGSIAATLSFRASFKAKTGRLYRNNKDNEAV